MKTALILIVLMTVYVSISFPQETRKVLVEVFTNSHCGNCPAAHNALDNYTSSSGNGDKLSFIYYHMIYPYSDDPLYHHNPEDSDGRHNYYQPIAATPRGFFDGEIQGAISTWASKLDQLTSTDSPIKIILSGSWVEETINIIAEITRTGDVTDNDLVIHFVVVENVQYQGRNGIALHKDVMRDMVTSATGESFTISQNETKEVEKEIALNSEWNPDSLKVVVFIQSAGSMNVYQSEFITYEELKGPTNINPDETIPSQFVLEQNYPNPFNPSTKIRYHLPEENFVTLGIYNILGSEVAILVNKNQQAGIYEYTFNTSNNSSGVYFYKLIAVNSSGEKIVQTRKMTLLR